MENLIKEIGHFDRKQFTDELEKRLFDNSQNIRFPLEILPTRLQEIIRAEIESLFVMLSFVKTIILIYVAHEN